jgi:hypothetical protein
MFHKSIDMQTCLIANLGLHAMQNKVPKDYQDQKC